MKKALTTVKATVSKILPPTSIAFSSDSSKFVTAYLDRIAIVLKIEDSK